MINKSYENTSFINVLVYLLVIIECIFFISLNYYKISKYYLINGIVYTDELILVVVDKSERKDIYNNSFFYIDNKKINYLINEDRGITLKKNNTDYYEILLDIKINKKYKINDSINISIKKKNEKIINIFNNIWEDD